MKNKRLRGLLAIMLVAVLVLALIPFGAITRDAPNDAAPSGKPANEDALSEIRSQTDIVNDNKPAASEGFIVKLRDASYAEGLTCISESSGLYRAETQEQLDAIPDTALDYCEPDFKLSMLEDTAVNDTLYVNGAQWNLENMNVPAAWAKGQFGDGVTVAVIDSGLYGAADGESHEDIDPAKVIYRPIMQSNMFSSKGINAANRLKIVLASILGCVITLQLGAFSVVLETTASGITELPFGAFCALMQPIHLAIGLIEGIITSAVLLFVYETRPELLKDVKTDGEVKNKCSLKTTLVILAVVVAVVGGGLSLIASGNPDGLEWALFGNEDAGYNANMSLDEDNFGVSGSAADKAEQIQEKTAFLPDYAFASDGDNPAGTTVSGIVGSAMVAGVAVLVCLAGGFFRKKKATSEKK